MLESHEHKDSTHNFDGITENRENSPPVYFTILFYGLVIWGIAFSAFYLLSGWSSDAEFQEKMATYEQTYKVDKPSESMASTSSEEAKSPTVDTVASVDGASIYSQRCAMCHGSDAKGGVGPDLTVDDYAQGKTPEAITNSIANGVGSAMPAFGGQLNDEEIKALVDYLLSL